MKESLRGKKLDLAGKKFGRLTVIKRNGRNKYRAIKWLCKCECGNIVTVLANNLTRG